jgi:hypothetical protein
MMRTILVQYALAGALLIAAAARAAVLWETAPAVDEGILPTAPVQPLSAASSIPSAPLPRSLFTKPTAAPDADVTSTASLKASRELPRLVGVVISDGNRVAIVSHAGKLFRAGENSTVGTWTVTQIETRSTVLVDGREAHVLQLDPHVSRPGQ